jgi:hypothetical protein
MEFRDWERPKPTSAWWLLFFTATLPCVGVLMDALHGRGFSFPWGRTSFTVGFSIGVIAFLWQYVLREKVAWRSLESRLREEVCVVEDLRGEVRALQERIAKLETPASPDREATEPGDSPPSPEPGQPRRGDELPG